MAVLLDGESWAARRTVGDRDGLPQDVLSRMLGWPAVERIWMPAWLADRDEELAEIERAFAAALERLESDEPFKTGVESDTDDDVSLEHADVPSALSDTEDDLEALRAQFANLSSSLAADETTAPPAVTSDTLEEPLVAWSPRPLGSVAVLDHLQSPRQRQQVAEILREIVEIEGPIHHDRLVRAIGTGFGLSRVVESRRTAILAALPQELRGERGEPFAWPTRIDRTTWRGYRKSAGSYHRPIEQISPHEIANAMAVIAHQSAGIEISELKREALEMFGLKRMTVASEEVLNKAIEFGIKRGRLVMKADGIVVRGD
jgi:hypothetical protein